MDTAGRTTDRETGGIQTPGPTAKTITTSPAPDPTAAALIGLPQVAGAGQPPHCRHDHGRKVPRWLPDHC
jgi:hypothetical protein